MIGALIGDYVGSRFEFSGNLHKDFELVTAQCKFTDDSILTVAMAKTLLESKDWTTNHTLFAKNMVEAGSRYPNPEGGYGKGFNNWLVMSELSGLPLPPYNSYGNGSAMRTAPLAYMQVDDDLRKKIVTNFASVTHNHPEGIKGALATVDAIRMARAKWDKKLIKLHIENDYGYTIEDPNKIRGIYQFNETCQETVPQAIGCFVYSDSFEDSIRNACSLGGDADTLAAIVGSISFEYYRGIVGECPSWLVAATINNLDAYLKQYTLKFLVEHVI